jgi:hypothetical protein
MKTLRFPPRARSTNSKSRSSPRASKSWTNGSSWANCSTGSTGSNELLRAWRRAADRMEQLIERRPRVARLVVGELEMLLDRLE